MQQKYRLWIILFIVCLMPTEVWADSGVKLMPRVDDKGQILNPTAISEDFVLFGKYCHRLESPTGPLESEPTPILWRVMSLDNDIKPMKATLLSHYVLESMAYQVQDRADGQNRNTWRASEVQKWLNSVSMAPGKLRSSESATIKGFLYSEYFSVEEKNMLMLYGDGTNGKITLPSGEADVSLGRFQWQKWLLKGELIDWLGPHPALRKAFLKMHTTEEEVRYWTRSPLTETTSAAWTLRSDGLLGPQSSRAVLGVRPVCALELLPGLFKVPLSFLSASDTTALPGTAHNPYMLYLAEGVPFPVASISGDILRLDFAVDIAAIGQWPDRSDFSLSGGKQNVEIEQVFVSTDAANTLCLNLSRPVDVEESLSLRYVLSIDETGALSAASGAIRSSDSIRALGGFTLQCQ